MKAPAAVLAIAFTVTLSVFGQTAPEDDLFTSTIHQDLATAGTSELIEWAVSLGLSTRGTRRDVERRILEYYGIEEIAPDDGGTPRRDADEAEEAESPAVTIESARGSSYFTIAETDERYLRLVGGVELTMTDNGTTHRIYADELTINLERSTMSAVGSVEYRVERPEETETFRGESIVFNIENWDGVFLRGVTDTGQTIDEETLDFTLFGERITRSSGDIVVVDDGRITSSVSDPPNYEIRARRIWLLAPGEWAIRSATLYVGRVPMFYIPYFFFPGDTLFFNPAVGLRSREGAFIQTTTYLFGESEEAEAPFSIMQIAEAPSDEGREIQGLFLRVPEEPKEITRPKWSLKIMADLYTTLGYYAGMAGSQPDLGPFRTFDWRVGVGTSRNIYLNDQVYTSFYVDDEGNARRIWNRGYAGNRSVPLRYETELDTGIQFPGGSWDLQFEMLSDPRFRGDYHDRSENIDWTQILNQTGEEETTPTDTSSLRWSTQLRWNPSLPALRPWITTLQLSSLSGELRWNRRTDGTAPEEVLAADRSPEASFFYPATSVLPSAAVDIRGTLLELPLDGDDGTSHTSGRDENETARDDEQRVRPPWERRVSDERESIVDERFRLPPLARDLPGIAADRKDASLTVDYWLRPTLRIDRVSDNSEWATAEDIDFQWRYRTLQNRNRGTLSVHAVAPGGYLRFDGTTTAEQRYQSVDIESDMEETQREQLQTAAERFRSASVSQQNVLTAYPLLDVPSLEGTTIRHEMAFRLYDRSYDTTSTNSAHYITRYGDWSPDGIRTHAGTATLRWTVRGSNQSFSARAVLPPLSRVYTGTATVETGPLTSTLSGGIRELNDEWSRDPLVQTHRFSTLGGNISAYQRLEYDMKENRLARSDSQLRLWPLRWDLEGRLTRGYEFVQGTGWVDHGEPSFHWTSTAVGIDAEPSLSFWKRRVNLALNGAVLLEADLQRFTSSSLILDYGFDLDIHQFLTLGVSARSRNDLIYHYAAPLAEEVDRPYRNPITDLVNSLRFSDKRAREESFFKIESVEIRGVHDLKDWELTFSYTGGPELDTSGGEAEYRWQGIFAVLFRWRPISEIRRDIRVEDGVLEFIES